MSSAGAHYIAVGLARDPPLNLSWNSSELPDEQGPFFRVIDWSKNYFLFFPDTAALSDRFTRSISKGETAR